MMTAQEIIERKIFLKRQAIQLIKAEELDADTTALEADIVELERELMEKNKSKDMVIYDRRPMDQINNVNV